ncbi:uncharacterized protein ColSpa_06546 [Colletotrichum spaethianum]|uniref:Uncharacterized protein n=1 Tax=Colletotrichum spaethianum TaxID=700344 RepID=A0AA37LH02_9PEZI|nr:uncharacterized protein ColSpa_06546 [Colletotrichum spaethianum]GKT46365.1 hypothetical protein ColSpa_06546 [Colletotrichum spaethianum]
MLAYGQVSQNWPQIGKVRRFSYLLDKDATDMQVGTLQSRRPSYLARYWGHFSWGQFLCLKAMLIVRERLLVLSPRVSASAMGIGAALIRSEQK